MAAEANHLEIIRELLAADADPNCRDIQGNTPLIKAAKHSNGSESVHALLAGAAAVDLQNDFGETALSLAVHANSCDSVRALIESGADCNQMLDGEDVDADSVLIYAVGEGGCSAASVQALVNGGADVNRPNMLGMTALMAAQCWCSPLEIVSILLAAGADPCLADNDGETALFKAAQFVSGADILRTLIAAGAEVFDRHITAFIKDPWYQVLSDDFEMSELVEEAFNTIRQERNRRVAAALSVLAPALPESVCSEIIDWMKEQKSVAG